MDHRRVVVTSVEEMNKVAAEVAVDLQAGQILLLYGELGAGKTTFVQGLAKALGITDRVTSPTFVIASEYTVPSHSSIHTLVHIDLYRLEEGAAVADPAVQDALSRASDPHLRSSTGSGGQAGRLTVIEWADRLGEHAPKTAQRISFSHAKSPTERLLTFLQ